MSPEHPESRDAEKPGNEGGAEAQRKVRGVWWLVVMVALVSATFLCALDNTIMANVRPSIVDTFGRIDMLPWLSISYQMGETGANPLWGKLHGQFNNKLLYIAAMFIFELGSAVIGSAQSIQAVVVGRAIAGIGGSGTYVGVINIISAMTVPTERTQHLNYVGMAYSLGTVLGPVIGGAFADSTATWRWAFYINICFAALTVPAVAWLVPPVQHPSPYTLFERIKRIDYVGTILFLGGVVSIVMILGLGGAEYHWTSRQMIGLYVATPVIWVGFCLQQGLSLLTVDRIFPAQLVRRWEIVNMFSWTAIAISNAMVTIYSLPLFFQFAYGDTSLRSAVYTLPFIFALVVGAGLSGPIFSKSPFYMPWFAGSSALMLVGNGLLSTIRYNTSRGAIFGYSVIQGLGVGPVIQLGYTVAQTKVPQDADISQVTAFLTCAQMAGPVLSLGIATSIFLDKSTTDIAAILPETPRSVIQDSINGARTGFLQTLGEADRIHVLEAIARNVGKGFYLNIAGAGLGFVTSLAMRPERLRLDS